MLVFLIMISTRWPFWLLFITGLTLFSCHSKKLILRGEPGEIVQPEPGLPEKYSLLLGVEKKEITNGRLYAFIDQWMGTPYQFGGLDKNGIDCSGFALLLEQQVYGKTLPRSTSEQINFIKRKFEDELLEGDLLFFDFDGKKYSHVGIYLQNGYLVHASSSKGVILVRLHDPTLYKHFSRAGSIILADSSMSGKSK